MIDTTPAAPSPADRITAISDVITAAGIVIGGLWALYVFGVKRIVKPRIELGVHLAGKRPGVGGVTYHLRLSAKNTGNVGLRKRFAVLQVYPRQMRPGFRSATGRMNAPAIFTNRSYEVFLLHTYLEPGESYTEDILLVVPAVDFVEFRLILHGSKPNHSWMFHAIINPAY
jgi:hypothetical protein